MFEGGFFLVSDKANFITGEILDVNGGFLMDRPEFRCKHILASPHRIKCHGGKKAQSKTFRYL